MDSTVEKGRTIQEAVNKALQKLNTTMENVDIQIIEKPGKKWLGMMAKPAVVKVTKIQKDETLNVEEREPEQNDNMTSGRAWVKGGNIFFEATEEAHPSIVPCAGIKLYKNGTIVHEETTLNQGDTVRIEPERTSEDGTFSVSVDDQKMAAFLTIIPGYSEEAKLVDQPPTTRLILKAVINRRAKPSISVQDVVNELQEKGIVYGVNQTAISSACLSDKRVEVKIAEGTPADKGHDGYVEFVIDIQTHRLKPKELPDGTVDFRDVKQIPTVKQGETIGIIHPPKKGKAGKTITGDTIPAMSVKEVTVKGKGIKVEGAIIRAEKSGAPTVQIRRQTVLIDVNEKYDHRGDVDMKSGNISFEGDVEISGNVRETMRVEAKEKLLIHGSVYEATVKAGSTLVVNKNVINSKLIVGMSDEREFEMLKQLEELGESVQIFRSAIEQLLRAQRQKRADVKPDMALIVRMTLVQRFSTLPKRVSFFADLVNESARFDSESKETARLLLGVFVKHDRSLLAHERIFVDIEEKLKRLKTEYEIKLQPFAVATLSSSQQSEIHCNGDVFLTGKGAYNTKIEARGKVHVNGFIRGGSIHSDESIRVREVGSAGGVETFLSVPAGKEIMIGHVMEDTVIQIGKKTYKFVTDRKNVRALLNEEGDIRLAYLEENV